MWASSVFDNFGRIHIMFQAPVGQNSDWISCHFLTKHTQAVIIIIVLKWMKAMLFCLHMERLVVWKMQQHHRILMGGRSSNEIEIAHRTVGAQIAIFSNAFWNQLHLHVMDHTKWNVVLSEHWLRSVVSEQLQSADEVRKKGWARI